ncbi:MAG: hypothetical protein HOW73_09855 [Polyangiaceae bacterium]|nr:hypothetical protein [Polyangiaceae bacterium]
MAEVVIRLVVNKATGKKDVIISYASDEDALPMEHEDAHRRVVDALLEGGALKAAEVGEVIVTRADLQPKQQEASAQRDEEQAHQDRRGVAGKGG